MEYRRRLPVGAVVGASLGVLLVLLLADNAREGGIPAAVLDFPIGLGALGAAAVSWYAQGKRFGLHQRVPVVPKQVRQHATGWHVASGWTLQGGTPDALAFTRGGRSDPNARCLLLLGPLPFLLMSRPRQTLTIQVWPGTNGSEVEIIVSPRGSGGQASAVRFFTSFHSLPDLV